MLGRGGKCTDGALGIALWEVVVELLANGEKIDKAEQPQFLNKTKLIVGSIVAITGGNVQTAATSAHIAVENNFLKAITTTKVVKKALGAYKKNGKVKKTDLKRILKEEGLSIADNILTLTDGTLDWDDALEIVDLVVGTEFNKANAGRAKSEIEKIIQRDAKYVPNK